MLCQGKQIRDICPYRFVELCMYCAYEGNDIEPCKNHPTLFSIEEPILWTPNEIDQKMREWSALLARMKLRVVK